MASGDLLAGLFKAPLALGCGGGALGAGVAGADSLAAGDATLAAGDATLALPAGPLELAFVLPQLHTTPLPAPLAGT